MLAGHDYQTEFCSNWSTNGQNQQKRGCEQDHDQQNNEGFVIMLTKTAEATKQQNECYICHFFVILSTKAIIWMEFNNCCICFCQQNQ